MTASAEYPSAAARLDQTAGIVRYSVDGIFAGMCQVGFQHRTLFGAGAHTALSALTCSRVFKIRSIR